jgi:hypothetical protein
MTEFIGDVGFTTVRGREPTARMLEFTYVHQAPDPENPGAVIDTPTRVSVPLLSLVPIPNIRIAEATITFGADIVDMRSIESRPSAVVDRPTDPSTGMRPSTLPGGVQLIAAYASVSASEGGPGSALSISIKVVREPPTEGLVSVQHLLTEAIRARPLAGK